MNKEDPAGNSSGIFHRAQLWRTVKWPAGKSKTSSPISLLAALIVPVAFRVQPGNEWNSLPLIDPALILPGRDPRFSTGGNPDRFLPVKTFFLLSDRIFSNKDYLYKFDILNLYKLIFKRTKRKISCFFSTWSRDNCFFFYFYFFYKVFLQQELGTRRSWISSAVKRLTSCSNNRLKFSSHRIYSPELVYSFRPRP